MPGQLDTCADHREVGKDGQKSIPEAINLVDRRGDAVLPHPAPDQAGVTQPDQTGGDYKDPYREPGTRYARDQA